MSTAFALPSIIQGGMGVGVSGWQLAHAVSSRGQLGVVSGTGLDTLLIRRLVDGDPGGHLRRAMASFPVPGVAEAIIDRYFRPDGRADGEPYPLLSMYRQQMDRARHQLTALANYVEVWLAKQGHGGAVGLNLLTKIQLPNLASLYGAMLAGVDYVLMGAGIPREIPAILDRLSTHDPVEMTIDAAGMPKGETASVAFDPGVVSPGRLPVMRRPAFVPIVASNSLATAMVRKSAGRVDGIVVEGPTAGGHNAPPRGPRTYNDRGEPVYGERDRVDLSKIADLGLPFWVAGGEGHPDRLRDAKAAGATGIQVGTLFAYCDESGLTDSHKRRVREAAANGRLDVFTDDDASPAGFPFKTVQLEGTLADPDVYERRTRRCDLGYLRTPFRTASGRLDFRCPAEPQSTWVKKGGDSDQTAGRKCLCNALMANVGHAQILEDGTAEPGLFTAGDDLADLGRFLAGRTAYSASDVLDYLLGTDTT